MRFQKLTFSNASGQNLAARLDLPLDKEPTAYVLFAHCFTCTKNLKAVSHISNALTAQGMAVLRFDFTGLGESEGDFADTNFSSNVEDLVAAADYMRDAYEAPQLLLGHSLGGAAVLMAAHQVPECRGVVTIGAPCNPEHVTHLLECSRDEIEKNGYATVKLAGRPFTIKKQFLDDLEDVSMLDTIGQLRRALLIFHAPMDNTVGIANAERIFKAAKHPKSYVSLDKADHWLTAESDALYVGSVLAAWGMNYIEPHTAVFGDPADDGYEHVYVRTGSDHYRTEIRASGHALIADEPESVGGTDLGPNPYEYLLAALGTCSTITMRMYADRKKWPMTSAVVRLKHQKVHADDCEDCLSKDGKIDVIEREIEIVGDELTAEQRQRIREIADKCPVHRTLQGEIKVRTTSREG